MKGQMLLPLTAMVMQDHEASLESSQLDACRLKAIECIFEYHTEFCKDYLAIPTENTDTKQTILACKAVLKQKLSQHECHSMLFELDYGMDDGSIFTSATTDPMHAFLLGVLKYSLELLLDEFGPTFKAEIDSAIRLTRSTGSLRQSDRKRYPRANLVKGITNLTKVTAEELDGVAFHLYMYFITATGREKVIKQYAKALPGTGIVRDGEVRYKKVVFALESLLSFHAWSQYGPFGLAGKSTDADMANHIVDERVRQMLHCVTETFPREKYNREKKEVLKVGHGWKIQKLHELTHLASVVRRTGSLANINAAQGESHLKTFAKAPAATSQKTTPQVFLEQAVNRIEFSNALDRCFRLRQKDRWRLGTTTSAPNTQLDRDYDGGENSLKLQQSSYRYWGRLFEIHMTADQPDEPNNFPFKVLFPNPRYKNVQALDPFVEKFLTGHFANECRRYGHDGVHVLGYSQWAKGDFSIRSHPHYMGGIWYDWVLADFITDHGGDCSSSNSDESEQVPSRKAQLDKYFGSTDHIAMSRTDVDGYLSWYEELVPARVVGLITYQYIRKGDIESAGPDDVLPEEHQLVVHCAKERPIPKKLPKQTKQNKTVGGILPSERNKGPPLLSQKWEMEYLDDNNPALRLVEPENISGTVLVREDVPDRSPFIPKDQMRQSSTRGSKKQRSDDDNGVKVYSILDRKDAWPRQFLASVEQLVTTPQSLA
jgi:hypothetical protein